MKWLRPHKITFREKIKLLFKPMKTMYNLGEGFVIFTYYKKMNNKVYVLKEEILRLTQEGE